MTPLYHVTSPGCAVDILRSGVYRVNRALQADAVLNMSNRSRGRAAFQAEGKGAVLTLEWNGPVEEMKWDWEFDLDRFRPDVLYHQSVQGGESYWRSFVLPGTRNGLSVVDVEFIPSWLAQAHDDGPAPGLLGWLGRRRRISGAAILERLSRDAPLPRPLRVE